MSLKSYRDLNVWHKAMDLAVAVYRLTDEFPREEKYGIRSQIQRAAVSVPSNISKGYERKRIGEYLHHLSIARGSLAEAETLLTLAVRLGYIEREQAVEVWRLMQEVGKMLGQIVRLLERKRDGHEHLEPST